MADNIKHSFYGGKYEVTSTQEGLLTAKRYGEDWRDLTGDSLILAMLYEVDSLKTKIEEAKNCLVCSGIADPLEVCNNTLAILEKESN